MYISTVIFEVIVKRGMCTLYCELYIFATSFQKARPIF